MAEKTTPRERPTVLYTPEDAGRALETFLSDADDARAAALDTLELVYRARAQVLTRSADRLDAGSDPRATLVAAAARSTEEIARRLQTNAARARVVEPAPTEDTAQVHGHVLDHRLDPVPGANVHVLDRTGKRIRGASASTDARGYFLLEWTPPAGGGARGAAVRLRVTAGTSHVLHEERRPAVRRPGGVEYKEIVVPEEHA